MHKIIRAMATACDNDVRAAYIARMSGAKGRRQRLEGMMDAAGFERVDAAGPLTADGREVVSIGGLDWALRPEVHKERLAAAFAAARVKQATPQSYAQCPALIDGQLCGGTLVRTPICPKCDLGRHGVAATLTCDVCGAVTAEMRRK